MASNGTSGLMAESPTLLQITEWAHTGNRFAILKQCMQQVKPGQHRVSDVYRVGPAKPDKFKLDKKTWQQKVGRTETDGQCKGFFLAEFKQKQLFRRCDAAAEEFCPLCTNINTEVNKLKFSKTISIDQFDEYAIVNQSLFARKGVRLCKEFWHETVTNRLADTDSELPSQFPYFDVDNIIDRLMVQGRAIFKNGGKGGRTYSRSKTVVEAQDMYLRICIEAVLTILQYENGAAFKNRWEAILQPARLIHEEMIIANASSDMPQCGAIQAPDIIQEELLRAATFAVENKTPAEFVSFRIKALYEWALSKQELRSPKSYKRSPSSKSNSTSPKYIRCTKKSTSKSEANAEHQRGFKTKVTSPPPIFKKFVVKESGIANAGNGLFLAESAKSGERIARFSGVVLTQDEANSSSSRYRLQISKNPRVILCADAETEWEGKFAQDGPRAGIPANARFAAATVVNECSQSKRLYVCIIAKRDINDAEEVFLDYQWDDATWKSVLQTNTPVKSSALAKEENVQESRTNCSTPDTQQDVTSEQKSTVAKKLFDPTITKTYAVAVGRCVGLFRSHQRVFASTFKYPGNVSKRFESEREARSFLAEYLIFEPRCYWKSQYDSGSLLQNAKRLVTTKVMFPVGLSEEFYREHGKGYVTRTTMEDDERVWKVQMLGGILDTMTEWPLLCGIDQAQRSAETNQQNSVEDARSATSEDSNSSNKVVYGIRGTNNGGDGVVYSATDLAVRLQGPDAEFSLFHNVAEATTWVKSTIQWCAVRLQTGQGLTMSKSQIRQTFGMNHGLIVCGPTDLTSAKAIANHWSAQANKTSDNPVNSMNNRQHTAAETTRVEDSSIPTKPSEDGAGVAGRGAHAQYRYRSVPSEGVRGRDHSLVDGHESSKSDSYAPNMQSNSHANAANSNTQCQSSKSTTDQRIRSPEEGIQFPEADKVFAKEQAGEKTVYAVRTYPDAFQIKKAAGSIWTTSADAQTANKEGGRMKVCLDSDNICENIAEGADWIRKQIDESRLPPTSESQEKHSIAAEFERRMQEARQNRQEATNTNQTTTPNKNNTKDDSEKDAASDVSTGTPTSICCSTPAMSGRGGLKSAASVLLDKAQAKVSRQLFPKNAWEIEFIKNDVPELSKMGQIPVPGKAQALTSVGDNQSLTFDNNMTATLAPKKFSTFKAFTLAELLEFAQRVEYIAQLQPEENMTVTKSVVKAVRVIVEKAVRAYSAMKDTEKLGEGGKNFKAFTYLYLMYLVMFRQVYTGTMAEMFFRDFAKDFATKARGCPGMAAWTSSSVHDSKQVSNEVCLKCGECGHKASDPRHQAELAEGTASPEQLRHALANVASNKKLNTESKQHWSSRIKAFYKKVANPEAGGDGGAP